MGEVCISLTRTGPEEDLYSTLHARELVMFMFNNYASKVLSQNVNINAMKNAWYFVIGEIPLAHRRDVASTKLVQNFGKHYDAVIP